MLENGMYKKLVTLPGITICLYILPGDVAEGQTVDVVPVELAQKLDQLQKWLVDYEYQASVLVLNIHNVKAISRSDRQISARYPRLNKAVQTVGGRI